MICATLKRRFLGYLIDVAVIYLITYVIFMLFPLLDVRKLFFLTAILFSWIYFIFLWIFLEGKTIGSIIFKTKIINESGIRNFNFKILFRAILISLIIHPSFQNLLGVAILLIYSINSRKTNEKYRMNNQMIWDIFSGTVVINEENGPGH